MGEKLGRTRPSWMLLLNGKYPCVCVMCNPCIKFYQALGCILQTSHNSLLCKIVDLRWTAKYNVNYKCAFGAGEVIWGLQVLQSDAPFMLDLVFKHSGYGGVLC